MKCGVRNYPQFLSPGLSACSGDSGGPLACPDAVMFPCFNEFSGLYLYESMHSLRMATCTWRELFPGA